MKLAIKLLIIILFFNYINCADNNDKYHKDPINILEAQFTNKSDGTCNSILCCLLCSALAGLSSQAKEIYTLESQLKLNAIDIAHYQRTINNLEWQNQGTLISYREAHKQIERLEEQMKNCNSTLRNRRKK